MLFYSETEQNNSLNLCIYTIAKRPDAQHIYVGLCKKYKIQNNRFICQKLYGNYDTNVRSSSLLI